MSVQSIHFHAKWDDTTKHLQTPVLSRTQKIGHIAWNVISLLIPVIGLARLMGYAVGGLANRITLPAARYIPMARLAKAKRKFNAIWKEDLTNRNLLLRNTFNASEHTIITPDGAALSVKCIRHKDANGSTPTVIYFNPNFEVAMEDPLFWLIPKSIENEATCNFVFFDYRGVGDSTGTFTAAKDLIVDGSSIVQWVRKYLKTPSEHIHFYGKSLGGAVAVQTQALDPEHLIGFHLNERSFASSDKMVQSMFGTGCLGKLFSWIFSNQGYGADAAAAFRKLKGQKLIVYHPEDTVIPYTASLQNAIRHGESLRLKINPDLEDHVSGDHHNAPIVCYEGATERMAQFLFGPPASYAAIVV